MTNRWLFRVNVANERETGETEKARGIGHAMKCLSVAEAVTNRDGAVQFSVEGADDVGSFFEAAGVDAEITTNHEALIEAFDPDVIVTDINYLSADRMAFYRSKALTVNLAPRGESKHYADLSFNSARISDVNRPADATVRQWYTGPEYAILHPDFVDLRNRLNTGTLTLDRKGIVIQMGGVDQFDLTGTVLRILPAEFVETHPLTVVAGPFNPHLDELSALCASIDNARLVSDPDNIATVIADHELGIFATGISTYEALAVGVPSVNLGQSTFHDRRGECLESQGLARYLGRHDELSQSALSDALDSYLDDPDHLTDSRTHGMDTVDAGACPRIVETVQQQTLDSSPN
jgi:spore coat polysaccharide biosynthesis predicted glycosyltransferase SpsG